MREFLERIHWKKALVLIFVGIAISLIYLIFNGFEHLINYSNALFISGFVLICLGALSFVAFLGTFDMFGYSGYYISAAIQKSTERKYENYKEYIEKKSLSRKGNKLNFLSYVIIGAINIAISFLLMLFL